MLDCLQAVQSGDVLAALADKHAAIRRHAIRIAQPLLKNGDKKVIDAVLALEQDTDSQVQLQLAYSLGVSDQKELGTALGRLAVRHAENKFLSAAIASSALPHLESMLDEVLGNDLQPQRAALVSRLFGMAVATDRYEAVSRVLSAATSGGDNRSAAQLTLLSTFLDALRQRGTTLPEYLQKSPSLLARKDAIEKAFASARNLMRDTAASLDSRVIAARLLGRDAAALNADLESLTAIMSSAPEPEILTEAVAALGRMNDARANELLFSNWKNRTPALRRAIIDSLLTRTDTINFLLDRIAATPALAVSLDTSRRQRLLGHSDEKIRKRATELLAANLESDRAKVVAQHEEVLRIHGDAKRGKEVFATVCAACHRLEEVGKTIGPDLTGLNDKSPNAMLVAILDPNRAVEDRYVQYIVTTNEGAAFTGKIDSETANGITLLGVDGEPKQFLRRDIRAIKSTSLSLMPEGLEQTLDNQKLADVIAYVGRIGSPPKQVAGNEPKLIEPAADGALTLLAENAEIYGRRLIFETQYRNLGFWERLDDQARWAIRVDKPGRYEVEIEFACADASAGNAFVLAADRSEIRANTVATGTWEKYIKRSIGILDLRKGFHTLTVRPDGKMNGSLMDLRQIKLVPAR